MLVPPVNFALVVGEVYRSGHPIALNQPFLDTLNLRTVVYVGDSAPQDAAEEYEEWLSKRNIEFIHLPMKSVKEPWIDNDASTVERCVHLIADARNHPILVHSDKGKHRVGVLVGVIRKCLQLWSLAPIFEEYVRFAKGKADADFLFIEQFKPETLDIPRECYPRWVHLDDDSFQHLTPAADLGRS